MEKWRCLAVSLLFSCSHILALSAQTRDGYEYDEEWGYVQVRPKAHMFWWLYKSPYRTHHPSKHWPTLLWLPGGPGVSGVGIGNFLEIGPLDAKLRPRKFSWLRVADLLFVTYPIKNNSKMKINGTSFADTLKNGISRPTYIWNEESPVGVGFSYVEDQSLLVRSDREATADLLTLLKQLYNKNPSRQQSPLYIVGESYGGKLAVSLALSILHATKSGRLKLRLGGAVLGSTWNVPEDYATSWGPLLMDVSRLDTNGLKYANRMAEQIKQQIATGLYVNATDSYMTFRTELKKYASFINFMYDDALDPLKLATADLPGLMNGVVRRKLQIIPRNLTWAVAAIPVFNAYKNDFMKPRIAEVDLLLAKGVDITIFGGQLDVVCSPTGTNIWLQKLKWNGLQTFRGKGRTPTYCGEKKATTGYVKSHRNLNLYWILGAGHYVPFSQPCASLAMAGAFTHSPAASK